MKSERGVTITSILIYITALTVVVILIGRINIYFYKNMNQMSENTVASAEYTKFNSYFTNEINIEGNEVAVCEENYIIFRKTENEYSYQNGNIYVNTQKIVTDVDYCKFVYNQETKVITVEIEISEKEFTTKYTVVK